MKLSGKITAPENLFVLLAVIFGFIFMVITPPFQPPDEWNHLFRAYEISEGGFVSHEDSPGTVGSLIPKNLVYAYLSIVFNAPYNRSSPVMYEVLLLKALSSQFGSDPFGPGSQHDWRRVTLSLFSMPLAASNRTFEHYPNTALYSPLAYAPQSAAIALGRLAWLPPIAFLYLARAVGLLMYILAVRWAIKIMPAMKWGMFAVALTPTALFQASSLSTDVMTNSAAFVLFALVMREAMRQDNLPISRASIWGIAICVALVAHLKFYLFIPLLVLMIPRQRGRMKAFIISLVLCVVLVSTWSYLVRNLYVPLVLDVSPSKQLEYISKNPMALIDAFARTMTERTGLFIMQFVGRFSHYNLYLPAWLAYLHVLVLIAIARFEGIAVSRYQRTVAGAVFFLSMGLLYFFNYLGGTPVGGTVINGVQGRYVYPVLLPALLMIAPLRKPGIMERIGGHRTALLIGAYSAALLIVSVSTIYTGYYG